MVRYSHSETRRSQARVAQIGGHHGQTNHHRRVLLVFHFPVSNEISFLPSLSAYERQLQRMSSKQSFRSVLPHEPLPVEEHGYLHLQGAFCPKLQKQATNKKHGSDSEDGVDATKEGDNEGKKKTEAPADAPSFWTKESLHDALSSLLCGGGSDALGLAFAAEGVEVVDAVAPVTKVRLVYKTPTQSLHVLIAWRRSITYNDHSESPLFRFRCNDHRG
jgi:hypothetical protein